MVTPRNPASPAITPITSAPPANAAWQAGVTPTRPAIARNAQRKHKTPLADNPPRIAAAVAATVFTGQRCYLVSRYQQNRVKSKPADIQNRNLPVEDHRRVMGF